MRRRKRRMRREAAFRKMRSEGEEGKAMIQMLSNAIKETEEKRERKRGKEDNGGQIWAGATLRTGKSLLRGDPGRILAYQSKGISEGNTMGKEFWNLDGNVRKTERWKAIGRSFLIVAGEKKFAAFAIGPQLP